MGETKVFEAKLEPRDRIFVEEEDLPSLPGIRRSLEHYANQDVVRLAALHPDTLLLPVCLGGKGYCVGKYYTAILRRKLRAAGSRQEVYQAPKGAEPLNIGRVLVDELVPQMVCWRRRSGRMTRQMRRAVKDVVRSNHPLMQRLCTATDRLIESAFDYALGRPVAILIIDDQRATGVTESVGASLIRSRLDKLRHGGTPLLFQTDLVPNWEVPLRSSVGSLIRGLSFTSNERETVDEQSADSGSGFAAKWLIEQYLGTPIPQTDEEVSRMRASRRRGVVTPEPKWPFPIDPVPGEERVFAFIRRVQRFVSAGEGKIYQYIIHGGLAGEDEQDEVLPLLTSLPQHILILRFDPSKALSYDESYLPVEPSLNRHPVEIRVDVSDAVAQFCTEMDAAFKHEF